MERCSILRLLFSCLICFVKVRCFFSVVLHLDYLLYIFLQFERGEALDNITQDVKRVLEEEGDEESLKVLSKAVDTVRKKVWSIVISLQI